MTQVFVLAFAFLSFSVLANAQVLDRDDLLSLERDTSAFTQDLINKRAPEIVDWIPSEIVEALATDNGFEVKALRQAMIMNIKKLMNSATIVSFEWDVVSARKRVFDDGSWYVVVPTETVLKAEGGLFKATNKTVAMKFNGKWRFVRVNSVGQLTTLRRVFPKFANEEFTIGRLIKIDG